LLLEYQKFFAALLITLMIHALKKET